MPREPVMRLEIEIDGRPAPLVARVNRRAKRLILKVDPASGEIHVTAPSKRALPEAIDFARERARWIAGQLDESLRARPFAAGGMAPLRGAQHKIIHDKTVRRPVSVLAAPVPTLIVGGEAAHLNRRLMDWMKREARKDLTEAVDRYSAALGKTRRAIRIRDTRSYWGSCASDGALSFSWRLIMAPPAILHYVAAHECAHLVHMNHSPAFWRLVKSLGADPRSAENWFKANGARLFVYGGGKG